MICEMCLFRNPPEADRCLCCKRMVFSKSARSTAEAREPRPNRPLRETLRDEDDTSVDWACIEPVAPPAGGSDRLVRQV